MLLQLLLHCACIPHKRPNPYLDVEMWTSAFQIFVGIYTLYQQISYGCTFSHEMRRGCLWPGSERQGLLLLWYQLSTHVPTAFWQYALWYNPLGTLDPFPAIWCAQSKISCPSKCTIFLHWDCTICTQVLLSKIPQWCEMSGMLF